MNTTIGQLMEVQNIAAYGTSEGSTKGWDTRGRVGKKMLEGIGHAIRHSNVLANTKITGRVAQRQAAIGARTFWDLKKMRQEANRTGRIGTDAHVEKLANLLTRHNQGQETIPRGGDRPTDPLYDLHDKVKDGLAKAYNYATSKDFG